MPIELLNFDPDGDLLLRLPFTEPETEHAEQAADGVDVDEEDADDQAGDPMDGENSLRELESNESEPEPQEEIHMLVSSKHLMLASPVFRAMLQHKNFKEGDTLAKTGRVEVQLPDDNHIALQIMLNLIHGRLKQVPRQVSLEVMTELSILVDKYETLEVFDLILDVWIQPLLSEMPTKFSACVLPWLSIAWVFQLSALFTDLTKILQHEGNGLNSEEQGHDLPIPSRIFDALESSRQKGLSDMFEMIRSSLERYQGSSGICQNKHATSDQRIACDGMMLGTFLRSVSRHSLWPAPTFPYNEISITMTAQLIEKLDIKSHCEYFNTRFGVKKSHGVKDEFLMQVQEIKSGLDGLDIKQFLPED